MSTSIMAQCWPLQMPPTAKAVLVSFADNASDDGFCWPSIPKICERTCFGRSAVIEAIKWLEAHGALKADRSDRYHTTYLVTPACYTPNELVRETNDETDKRASPPNKLVRFPDNEVREASSKSAKQTSPAAVLVRQTNNEVREPDNEVRQTDPNHQEPSITINKGKRRKRSPSNDFGELVLPDWISRSSWSDWASHRKAIRAPMTPRAAELSISTLAKLRDEGHDPTVVIENAIALGYRGLFPPKYGGHGASGGQPQPSSHADWFAKAI